MFNGKILPAVSEADRELVDSFESFEETPTHPRFRLLKSQEEVAVEKRKIVGVNELSADQKMVYDSLHQWFEKEDLTTVRLATIGGYAGTGKTTLSSLFISELLSEKKKVVVLTPTGKASTVLRRKLMGLGITPDYIGTIHGFLYAPILDEDQRLIAWSRRGRRFRWDGLKFRNENPKDTAFPYLDLVVVDEASMLDERLEDDIMQMGVPVLAVGDHGQLPPVHGRNTWMQRPMARLERIHRQAADNPILALATFVREESRLPPKDGLEECGVGYCRNLAELEPRLLDTYARVSPAETAMLGYTNQLRNQMNSAVHEHLFGSLEPRDGSQVICLKNNKPLINGMRGFVRGDVKKDNIWYRLRVEVPDDNLVFEGAALAAQFGHTQTFGSREGLTEICKKLSLRVRDISQLGELFDFGYALTVHKSQGSEFREVFLLLERSRPKDYARWLYTAITRASQQITIVDV